MIPPFTIYSGDSPVGSIIAYAGVLSIPVSSPPDSQQTYNPVQQKTGITNNIESFGWMVCDGRLLYCRAYPELFQAIGFLYSLEGEPTTVTDSLPADQKFRIPDYRGYFLRGAAGNSKNDPDVDKRKLANSKETFKDNINKIGSFQDDALQTHEHQYSKTSETDSAFESGAGSASLATESPDLTSVPTDAINANPSNGGIRISSETRSKNVYVNYLIKHSYVKW